MSFIAILLREISCCCVQENICVVYKRIFALFTREHLCYSVSDSVCFTVFTTVYLTMSTKKEGTTLTVAGGTVTKIYFFIKSVSVNFLKVNTAVLVVMSTIYCVH